MLTLSFLPKSLSASDCTAVNGRAENISTPITSLTECVTWSACCCLLVEVKYFPGVCPPKRGACTKVTCKILAIIKPSVHYSTSSHTPTVKHACHEPITETAEWFHSILCMSSASTICHANTVLLLNVWDPSQVWHQRSSYPNDQSLLGKSVSRFMLIASSPASPFTQELL